jgi:hypothetical protein
MVVIIGQLFTFDQRFVKNIGAQGFKLAILFYIQCIATKSSSIIDVYHTTSLHGVSL